MVSSTIGFLPRRARAFHRSERLLRLQAALFPLEQLVLIAQPVAVLVAQSLLVVQAIAVAVHVLLHHAALLHCPSVSRVTARPLLPRESARTAVPAVLFVPGRT
jgi:hypothetical protein